MLSMQNNSEHAQDFERDLSRGIILVSNCILTFDMGIWVFVFWLRGVVFCKTTELYMPCVCLIVYMDYDV